MNKKAEMTMTDERQSEIITFLYAAVSSADDTIRGYDTKAQIVGIGYIFSMGIIGSIGDMNSSPQSIDSFAIFIAWLLVIVPIVLFGAVLYPSRKRAPFIGAKEKEIKQLFYAISYRSKSVQDYMNDIQNADFVLELSYELMKLTALRDLKRARFLRALLCSGFSLIVIFASQLHQSLS